MVDRSTVNDSLDSLVKFWTFLSSFIDPCKSVVINAFGGTTTTPSLCSAVTCTSSQLLSDLIRSLVFRALYGSPLVPTGATVVYLSMCER